LEYASGGSRAQIKCVQGHLPFAPDLFAPRAITCFTILRDPVERVVSEYYYNLREPERRFHAAINRNRMTLAQFVRGEQFAEVHNLQTRILAGANAGASPRELLDSALANLRDRMAMVGVSERLDETLLACRAIFGWRRLVYRRVNVTSRRPRLGAIDPETIATIERANSLDRTLYHFACERLDEVMREYRITDSEVIALRRAARIYSAAAECSGCRASFGRRRKRRGRVAASQAIVRAASSSSRAHPVSAAREAASTTTMRGRRDARSGFLSGR
jgi:hypothetical protein